ncbi:MAG TPA: DUF58 domain-containing protein [Planctomycetota bacterium]|nr:DUF58 domain-containing protein [Planctomycetota bacterium]
MTGARDSAAEAHERELEELLAEVRRIDVQSRRLVAGAMAGGYVSVFRGAGIEFEEVREYVPGDDPRSVDWNVSARMGRPFVKKYKDERERTVVFLLDLSASMTGGFGIWSARQTAARVVACLALSAARNGDKTALVTFGEEIVSHVAPRKGPAHALRIVRDCLALPGRGGTAPAAAIGFASHAFRRGAIVFLVSDFLSRGWERPLTLCARRHDVVAVRIRAPELAPPDAGLLRVRDPETGRSTVVDWGSRRVRAEYAMQVAAWRDETEQALRRAKVDLLDVPVPRAPDRNAIAGPILRFFTMRELRGAKK